MKAHPQPPFDVWAWWQAWHETWAAAALPSRLPALRERRIAALIDRARRDSPFYRGRPQGPRLADFAPVGKDELMACFDDWATDRRITRAAAAAALADPEGIADAWLGEYLLWTSSGTSGTPGWFVQDARSLAAYDAIDALRLRGGGFGGDLARWGAGQRFAFVGATGDHFAGVASLQRLRRIVPPPWRPEILILSVQQPLRAVADALDAMQPSVLISYPSCAAPLAQWQREGSLHLRLSEVWVGGEQLSAAQRRQIATGFDCRLRNSYGASECFSIAFECEHGSLHVNDDWVVVEPVDERLQPVPAGTLSHATLLTNLANLTQPLIRYRLDDRIRVLPRCRCGSAFSAIEVEGRSADTLTLRDAQQRAVTILPLALETAIEEGANVSRFQVIGCRNGDLELRFESDVVDPRAAYAGCHAAIDAFLAEQGVVRTRVRFARDAPVLQGASGKLRRVINAPPSIGRPPSR